MFPSHLPLLFSSGTPFKRVQRGTSRRTTIPDPPAREIRRLTHELEFSVLNHQSSQTPTIVIFTTEVKSWQQPLTYYLPFFNTLIRIMEHSQLTSLVPSPSPITPPMGSRRRSRRACVGFVALAVGKSEIGFGGYRG